MARRAKVYSVHHAGACITIAVAPMAVEDGIHYFRGFGEAKRAARLCVDLHAYPKPARMRAKRAIHYLLASEVTEAPQSIDVD